jgi:thiol-disulfide isomerase/thioredoxin
MISRLIAIASVACFVLGGPSSSAPAPLPLTLQDPRTGAEVKLEPGPGVVHLAFFATWCPPCLAELDRLSQLEARFGADGYRLVLIAVQTRQSPARLAKFVEEREPPGRVLFDAAGRAQAALRAEQLPAHVVLDAAGVEQLRSDGLDTSFEEALGRLLAKGTPRS